MTFGESTLLPGVLPMSFDNQTTAQRLAMCNDIGEAAYVDSLIAAALFVTLRQLPSSAAVMEGLQQRYGVDPEVGGFCSVTVGIGPSSGDWTPVAESVCPRRLRPLLQGMTGETFINELGCAMFHGDSERAGQRLLKDFRTGRLGAIALERPPSSSAAVQCP